MSKERFSNASPGSGPRRGLILCLAGLLAIAGAATADETGRVYPDAESVEPLGVGAQVPHAEVRTIDGQSVDVATLVAEQGALLVFYRGGW